MVVVLQAPSKVPPTVAQQAFIIGSGIASGLAGIHLARELAKVQDVPTGPVIVATLVSIFFTFGAAVYITKNLRKTY